MSEINWEQINKKTDTLQNLLNTMPAGMSAEALQVGIDLGTSSILTVAINDSGMPVAGFCEEATVVRDGVVAEFSKAMRIVAAQRARLEDCMGTEILHASAAIPPGVSESNRKAVIHVLQGAGYEVSAVTDESTAAAEFLGVQNGAVVDVGGGSTGISILQHGETIFAADEPTGGHHMTLVLAGAMDIPYDEAEMLKRDLSQQDAIYPIVRPVAEKMAMITQKYIAPYSVEQVFVVGGASAFDQFATTFENILEMPVYKPEKPWLVTPLGISLADRID